MPFAAPRLGFALRLLALALIAGPLRAQNRASTPSASEAAPPIEGMLKIDIHAHVFEDLPQYTAMLRRINGRAVNVCVMGLDGHLVLMHQIALDLYHQHPDLYPFTSTFDLTKINQPGYAQDVIAWLDGTFKNGAVAVKIWKDVGLEVKRPDGSFYLPDDPVFDPIYDHLAKVGKPLHAHLAEPLAAWLPLDPDSPHYTYYSTNPVWHLYGKPQYPSHATIIAARDRIMAKHPDLIVIGAHLGSLEHDLAGIAQRLDRYPNFYIEVAARTRNLIRLPSDQVRALFLKYPDRIMYGTDLGWRPYAGGQATDTLRRAYVARVEERYRSDYAYYAGHGPMQYDGRTVQALGLPRSVLEKFYHGNVQRLLKLEAAWAGVKP
ncbi:MAG: hypothetical protein EXS38_09835 [Opitutus sp.]|nr:hypothetical protein [Opitutus sp.]